MRPIHHKRQGKRLEAEVRVGMPLETYFEQATKGKDQRQMAEDLGVSRQTVCNWLSDFGYEACIVYRRKRR